jgi:hypothetical protein
MSMTLLLIGGALFAAGAAVGGALTLALARDKITAMRDAAAEANAVIAHQSEDALKDLADAYAKAEAMIGVIETAKLSTARAESSVTDLIAKIHESRALIERVSRKEWFQPSARRLEREAPLETLQEPKKRPLLSFARRERQEPLAAE